MGCQSTCNDYNKDNSDCLLGYYAASLMNLSFLKDRLFKTNLIEKVSNCLVDISQFLKVPKVPKDIMIMHKLRNDIN